MAPLIEVTSDEVNHLIYAYLQDSGTKTCMPSGRLHL